METQENTILPQEHAAAAAAIEAGAPIPMTPEPAAADIDADTSYKLVLAPIVGVMCAVFCPNWQISPEEQGQIITAIIPLCRKYLPDSIGQGALPPEIGAALTLAIVLGPRLAMGIPARTKPKEVQEEEAKEAA